MGQPLRKRIYRLRNSAPNRGLEISLPSSLRDTFQVGAECEVIYSNDLVLIVPPGKAVDTRRLFAAFELAGV